MPLWPGGPRSAPACNSMKPILGTIASTVDVTFNQGCDSPRDDQIRQLSRDETLPS